MPQTDDLERTSMRETLYEVNSFVFGSDFLLHLAAAELVFGKHKSLIVSFIHSDIEKDQSIHSRM